MPVLLAPGLAGSPNPLACFPFIPQPQLPPPGGLPGTGWWDFLPLLLLPLILGPGHPV